MWTALLLSALAAAPDVAPAAEVTTVPDPATPERTAERRRRVAEALGDGILVAAAGKEGEGRFLPHDDFAWLAGAGTPEAVLVLVAEEGELAREVLYLPPRDPRHELWNGPRLAPGEEAAERSGIADTRPLPELAGDLEELSGRAARALAAGEPAEEALREAGASPEPARPLLRPLQAVKDEAELAAVRAAIEITERAIEDAMRVAVPGAYEFTAEAAITSAFRSRGARDVAFPPICGSGPNTCFLHYRANERRLEEGDLLLLDVGAKLHHYSADVSRTFPVSGRFTPRQREVYELVREAARRAAAVLRPGATLGEAHRVAATFLEEHGYGREAFPHSVGHGLGLRVHDAPARGEVLAPGMVVTIEPGLYLPDEEIGVRIEDDWLVTEDGAELLSAGVPSDPDEIEALIARLRGE